MRFLLLFTHVAKILRQIWSAPSDSIVILLGTAIVRAKRGSLQAQAISQRLRMKVVGLDCATIY